MKTALTRREVVATGAMVLAALATRPAAAALSQKARQLSIGYTGITWTNAAVEQAVQSLASLGFYGFETFGDNLLQWEAKGGLKPVLDQNKLPLISGYCTMILTEPAQLSAELDKARRYAEVIRKNGGRIFVLGPNQVPRSTYQYAANKANIIHALNEIAKTVQDHGLTPVLHQHTGTCVETRDETYATLDAMDTRVLKFGPDVGQLTKGGVDALKVVHDYLPLVEHMHLKDFNGKDPHLLGYCPLGQGQVNVPAILELMAGRTMSGMVMTELDDDWKEPATTPPARLAAESRDYLRTLQVRFRT